MTTIKPNKQNPFINRILGILIGLLTIGTISLVGLYSRVVNLEHGLAKAKAEIQVREAESGELKSQVFKLFDSISLEEFVRVRNLVQDKKPTYLTAYQQWPGSR